MVQRQGQGFDGYENNGDNEIRGGDSVMKTTASKNNKIHKIMKRLALIIVMVFGGITLSHAQAIISIDTLESEPGDSVTFTIYADGMANLGSITLYLQYYTSRLTWGRALNWHPLLLASNPIANASGGTVAISWYDPAGIAMVPPQSGIPLVQLRFKYNGYYSPMTFTGSCEVTDQFANVLSPVTYEHGAIAQPLRANAWPPAQTICAGGTANLYSSGYGGYGSYTYQWESIPPGFSATSAYTSDAPAANTLYRVIVSDGVNLADSIIAVGIFSDPSPGAVGGMLPIDGEVNLSLPIDFSWSPSSYTDKYDLYIWEDGTAQPATPKVSNITPIYYHFNQAIPYGKTYNWRIHSKNQCFETGGPIQQFTLRDLPDLIVTEITNGDTAYSLQTATIQWKIKNKGVGSTLNLRWYDGVYLCPDSVWNPATAIQVMNPKNLAWLQPGISYTTDGTFTISTNLVGKYYVFVKVNSNNQLLEDSTLNNYLRSDQTLTIIVPETPDMELTSFGAPTIANAADTIPITFMVQNKGGVHIHGSWRDRVYISPDSTINISQNTGAGMLGPNARPGYDYWHYNDTLLIDSSYSRTLNLIIPHTFFGKYYLRAVADDANNIFETASTNNLNDDQGDTIQVILRPPADLVVTAITPPAGGLAGSPINIQWDVQNQGLNPPYYPLETYWYDNVWISTLDTFNPSYPGTIYMGYQYHYNGHLMNFGDSYNTSKNFNLPNGISDWYFIYVKTDAGNRVWEYNMEGNNVRRSDDSIFISLLYADLIPQTLSNPDTIEAWVPFGVNWSVKNQGIDVADPSWSENFYISTDTVLNSGDCFLGSVTHYTALGVGATYAGSVTLSLPMPSRWAPGDYFILVKTDAGNSVYEFNYENNNVTWNPVYFKYWDDLELLNPVTSNPGWSGQNINVTWQGRSNEVYKLKTNGWYDKVWLSTDTILGGDYYLGADYHSGYMVQGQTYNAGITGTLPHGCNGNFYILIQAGIHPGCGYWDPCHGCVGTFWDIDMANNFKWIPITINLTPPCDLTIDTIIFPDTVYAGQSLLAPYTIDNIGVGATYETYWHDCVYLNTVPTLNSSAIRIGSYTRTSALAGGGSYTINMSTSIPSYLSGYYYVILVTDGRCNWPHYYSKHTLYCGHEQAHSVYEHYAEDNNIVIGTTLVIPPAPADLIVTKANMPDTAELGDLVSIPFTVKNIGPNTGVGFLRDAFYFSDDYVLQGDLDQLFGLSERNLVLHPGDSISGFIIDKIKDIEPGLYHGIASTDILNQVFETNDNNNETIAEEDTILITIEELFVSVPDTFMLDEGDLIYYQVTPGVNKDLRITLRSNQIFGQNEIYVAYGRVPALYDYDFIYEDPIGVDQQILIPATEAGPYYILVRTPYDYLGLQECIILAEALPFSIFSVAPDTLGQGRVTTRIQGAGFREGKTQIFMEDIPTGNYLAEGEIVNFLSSMQLDVKWDLSTGVPIADYHVTAVRCDSLVLSDPDGVAPDTTIWQCDTVKLDSAVFVNATSGLEVAFATLIPSVVRLGTWAYWTYFLKNTGNVDVPYWEWQYYIPDGVPNIITHSIDVRKATDFHVSMSMSDDNNMENDSTMVIPFIARDVRPDQVMQVNLRLRPGRVGGFPVSWKQFPQYDEWYNEQTKDFAERYRQGVFIAPSNYDPLTVLMAADSATLVDSLFRFWASKDLLDSNYFFDPFTVPFNSANDETFFLEPCGNYALSECYIHWRPDAFRPGFPQVLMTCKDSVLLLNETWGTSCTQVVVSSDPNDITGPEGYGDPQFVNNVDPMDYRIRFENDPEFATAPAQRVFVQQPLDVNASAFTFRLGSFGFGDFIFNVPDNSVSYTKRLDLPDSLGYDLDVSAGLNLINRTIFWSFQTIDPATGLAPTDPDKGFLLVNDSTGSGEGFVNYSISPAAGVGTGDTIRAKASIVFDQNVPIFTNEWFNTVDAGKPTSSMDALSITYDTTSIELSVTGSDNTGGAGLDYYKLYYSEDGTAFVEYPDYIEPDSTLWFTGLSGSTYGFFSIAVDNVGLEETMKTAAEETTTLEPSNDTIHGYITYASLSATPLSNVKVYLKEVSGSILDSVMTDATGYYMFTNQPTGDLCLLLTTTKAWGGNSAADALLLSRSVIGLEIFNDLQNQAADVNLSGSKTSADALLIKRRVIGLETGYAAGDWIFEGDTFTYIKTTHVADLKGLCVGDVNGSYSPPAKQQPGASLEYQGMILKGEDGFYHLPVFIDEAKELGSMTLFLNYPWMDFDVVSVSSEILEDMIFNVEDGMVKLAWHNIEPVMTQAGQLLLELVLAPTGLDASVETISLALPAEFTSADAEVYSRIQLHTPKLGLNIDDYELGDNYPNPFSGTTEFSYTMPEPGNVRIEIHDQLGHLVEVLVSQYQEAGYYTLSLDGRGLASGIYTYSMKVSAGDFLWQKSKLMAVYR